jgi:hypothetical protein
MIEALPEAFVETLATVPLMLARRPSLVSFSAESASDAGAGTAAVPASTTLLPGATRTSRLP